MNVKAVFIFSDFEKAVTNLRAAAAEAESPLEIDGAIKRFELCYELAWKLMKEHLSDSGIICKNPRDCFKAAKENDLITKETKWLKMIEDRNQLVHCYTYEQSREIYLHIKSTHVNSVSHFYKKIKKYYSKNNSTK